MNSEPRMQIQLNRSDLGSADLVVVLNGVEHIPLLKQRFADWADKATYWNIPDLNLMGPEEAFSQIEKCVTALIQQLRGNQQG